MRSSCRKSGLYREILFVWLLKHPDATLLMEATCCVASWWQGKATTAAPDYDAVRKAISDLISSEKAEEYDDGMPLYIHIPQLCMQGHGLTGLCTNRFLWPHPGALEARAVTLSHHELCNTCSQF